MEKSFEKRYSINISRFKLGVNEENFSVSKDFFEAFENAEILDATVDVTIQFVKYNTHLDARFIFLGTVSLTCDRCGEPFPFAIETSHRIIYSFEKREWDGEQEDFEVIYVDKDESNLSIIQELYDFINLALPLRRVPDESVHTCPAEVRLVLGLEGEQETEEKEIDPRWEQLKKLRDNMN